MKGGVIGFVAARSRKGRHWRVVKLVRIPARDMTRPGLWENQRFYMLLLENTCGGREPRRHAVEWLERPHHATQFNAKEADRWAQGWNEYAEALDNKRTKGD